MNRCIFLIAIGANVLAAQRAVEHGLVSLGSAIHAEAFQFANESRRITEQIRLIEEGQMKITPKPTPAQQRALVMMKARELRDISIKSLDAIGTFLNTLDDLCESVAAQGKTSAAEIRQLSQLLVQSTREITGAEFDPAADDLQRVASTIESDGDVVAARRQTQALHALVGRAKASIENSALRLGVEAKAGILKHSYDEAKADVLSKIPTENDLAPYKEVVALIDRLSRVDQGR